MVQNRPQAAGAMPSSTRLLGERRSRGRRQRAVPVEEAEELCFPKAVAICRRLHGWNIGVSKRKTLISRGRLPLSRGYPGNSGSLLKNGGGRRQRSGRGVPCCPRPGNAAPEMGWPRPLRQLGSRREVPGKLVPGKPPDKRSRRRRSLPGVPSRRQKRLSKVPIRPEQRRRGRLRRPSERPRGRHKPPA